MATKLDTLLADIRACRACVDMPEGKPLAHAPTPRLRGSRTARLCIAGQVPGTRVHASERRSPIPPAIYCAPGWASRPKNSTTRRARPSCRWGSAFRAWTRRAATCRRGASAPLDGARPFSRSCRTWIFCWRWAIRPRVASAEANRGSLTDTVANWRAILDATQRPRIIPLPHPSWRNNAWIKAHPWFEAELLPVLRDEVRCILDGAGAGALAARYLMTRIRSRNSGVPPRSSHSKPIISCNHDRGARALEPLDGQLAGLGRA